MKKSLLLVVALICGAANMLAATFQGVTERDKAVTYETWSNSFALIRKIDNSLISTDGILEIPEKVEYNGQYLSPIFMHNSSNFLSGQSSDLNNVKELVIHGYFFDKENSTMTKDYNQRFTNLESIKMENRMEGYSSSGGVLYRGTAENPYQTIIWVPTKWQPEGNAPFLDGTTTIRDYAFSRVEYVGDDEMFYIPDQIESIGAYAFQYTPMRGVRISENEKLTKVSGFCFLSCQELVQAPIPDNIITIGGGAFAKCTSLPSINLDNIESINSTAFHSCSSLESIGTLDNLKSLGKGSFYGCSKLQYIDIEQTQIKSIPEFCFYNCSSLKELKLPQGLTSIDKRALFGVNNLTTMLDLPESLVTIERFALPTFEKLKGETLHIGKNVKDMTGFSLNNVLCNIDIDSENQYFMKDETDNVIYNSNKTELVYYLQANTRKGYMVPTGVKKISDGAFKYKRGLLLHITLPSTCEEIGVQSFEGVESVTIPPSVKSLADGPLAHLTSQDYSSLEYNSKKGNLVTYYVFVNCGAIYFMGNNIEEISPLRNYFSLSTYSLTDRIYLTKTGYESAVADAANKGTKSMWYYPLRNNYYVSTNIPVTMSSTGLSTMCRDFDVDLSAADGLEAYVATSFQKGNGQEDVVTMAKVSTDDYVPSRVGADNYEFHGVLLKGEPGKTYYYCIGEQDYLSGNQTLLSDEQADGNMLVGAPINTYIDKTDGEMTNFVLKSGKFRYVSAYGELSWNKAYLQIPTADCVDETTGGAKNVSFAFAAEEGNDITGISSLVNEQSANADDAYYNLNGVRVTNPQKGVYIRNNKKIVIK